MELLSAVMLSALAEAIMVHAENELRAIAKGLKARILGDPEQRALKRALQRAFDETRSAYGFQLAEYDVNAGFFVHEGAAELAKVIVPGVKPSAARLAELCIDSLGPWLSDDVRRNQISALQPVFKTLLDALETEVRQESSLNDLVSRVDGAATTTAVTQLATHLGAAPATEEDETNYLRWLVDQHRYIRTAGMVRNTMVQLPLDEVFVGLSAQRDRQPGDRAREWFVRERDKLRSMLESGQLDQPAFEAALDRLHVQFGRKFPLGADGPTEIEQPLPVLDAVRAAQYLLVLGDPGTGKTTLLRYLALIHARALIQARAAAANTTIDRQTLLFPIYLRIGDYARWPHRPLGISEFLPVYLSGLECRTPGLNDLIQRRLGAGGCLVLLDGLDEIASADQRRTVVETVINFVTANSRQGNRFVVTSRISGYLAAPLPDLFCAVRLQDMDDPTIERFLEVYCREVERAETPNKSDPAIRHAGRREAAEIGQALHGNAGVRRLAANPLLLAALVLVHRANGRLPHRRVEAYMEVCNALGRTWRRVQGVVQADLPDERILPRWLAELGAWIHEHRPEGSATKRELLEVLGPLWATHHGIGWDPSILEAADPLDTDAGRGVLDFVDKVDRHTGLLVERAPGRYGFAHLTFEEYYTGRALAFRGAATQRIANIRRRLHDPRFDEPILLALGLIGTDQSEQAEQLVAEAIYPATANPSPLGAAPSRDRSHGSGTVLFA